MLHRQDGGFENVCTRLAALRQADTLAIEEHRQFVLGTCQ